MFALSFKNGSNYPTRNSFDKHDMPMVEIKVFNVLIENKLFFDQSATSKQETYEKRIDVLRNDDYTT